MDSLIEPTGYGTRKRIRDILQEEGIESKHLKSYFEPKSKSNLTKPNLTKPKSHLTNNEPQIEPKNICTKCEEHKKQIVELNKKFDSMIQLQSKLITLLEDIDYRFNDKGQMLSYIS
jgi:hypothetical protein